MSGGLEIEKYRIFFRQDAYFSETGASGTPRDGSGEVSEANCLQPQMLLGKPGWPHRQGEQGMVSKQGLRLVTCSSETACQRRLEKLALRHFTWYIKQE